MKRYQVCIKDTKDYYYLMYSEESDIFYLTLNEYVSEKFLCVSEALKAYNSFYERVGKYGKKYINSNDMFIKCTNDGL